MNPIWRAYFSDGLVQPPTSYSLLKYVERKCQKMNDPFWIILSFTEEFMFHGFLLEDSFFSEASHAATTVIRSFSQLPNFSERGRCLKVSLDAISEVSHRYQYGIGRKCLTDIGMVSVGARTKRLERLVLEQFQEHLTTHVWFPEMYKRWIVWVVLCLCLDFRGGNRWISVELPQTLKQAACDRKMVLNSEFRAAHCWMS